MLTVPAFIVCFRFGGNRAHHSSRITKDAEELKSKIGLSLCVYKIEQRSRIERSGASLNLLLASC